MICDNSYRVLHWLINNFECFVQKNCDRWKAAIGSIRKQKECHLMSIWSFSHCLNTTVSKWLHFWKRRQTLLATSSNSCLDILLITASIRVFRTTKSFTRLSNILLFTYTIKKKKITASYIGAPWWSCKSRPTRDYPLTKFLLQNLQNHIRAKWGCPISLQPCFLRYNIGTFDVQ